MTKSTNSSNESKAQPRGNYEVGYCRPPKPTRWVKGQSGNPRGARKLSSDFAVCAKEVLRETVVVPIRGRPTRMTVAKAITYKAGIDAAAGDARARNFLMEQAKLNASEGWTVIEAKVVFPEEDEAVARNIELNRQYLEEIRRLQGLRPDGSSD